MIALEIAGPVAIVALGMTATWMAIVGLLGVGGAVRLRRCRTCGHLITTTPHLAPACPYCRYPRLLGRAVHMRLHHFLPGEWQGLAPAVGNTAGEEWRPGSSRPARSTWRSAAASPWQRSSCRADPGAAPPGPHAPERRNAALPARSPRGAVGIRDVVDSPRSPCLATR